MDERQKKTGNKNFEHGKAPAVRDDRGKKPFDRDTKSAGDRKPFGQGAKPAGDRKPFGQGTKPAGDRKPFGQGTKPAGDRKPFGQGTKPAGDRKPFAQGSKPAFEKYRGNTAGPEGRKPFTPHPGRPSGSFDKQRKPLGPGRDPSAGTFGVPGKENAPFRRSEDISKSARFIALQAFEDVLHKDTYASMALDERMKSVNLSQVDKRLAGSITYKALENLIHIDWVLDHFLENRNSLPDQIVDILRISLSQMLFHDRIPDNAIVDEAVKLTRFLKMEKLTALVNGVLREIIRRKDEIEYPSEEAEPVQYLSIMFSMPAWITTSLIESYGYEEAKKICTFRREKHFITIRKNSMLFPDDAAFEEKVLNKKVWESEKSELQGVWRVYGISELARDSDYLSGHFSVQGEASILCARAVAPKMGAKMLDCCAAPGGKTACIAEAMHGTGRIYAWDVHDHRVALIRAMQSRLQLQNIRPAVYDSTRVKQDMLDTMDAVLLDAPCSGIGVMDDKPDIKLRVSQESVRELCDIQRKLLDVCSGYVKKGGTFVYSTCSILPEENTKQVQRFLKDHPEFTIQPLPNSIPEKYRKYYTENGLQLLSWRDDTEGFFIARMKRER